ARLTVGSKAQAPKLQLVRRAAIRQRTGEVWDNIALTLSTARPAAGTGAPVLAPLTIDFESDRIPLALAPAPPPRRSVTQAEAAREDERPSGGVRHHSKQLVAADEARANVEVQAFQALYGIAGRTTVLDTGEIKRVQIDETALDPALVVRTVPKR